MDASAFELITTLKPGTVVLKHIRTERQEIWSTTKPAKPVNRWNVNPITLNGLNYYYLGNYGVVSLKENDNDQT